MFRLYDYATVVRKLAEEYEIPFLPLQKKLSEKATETDASYYLIDGVHPHIAGATLIADEWVKLFKEIELKR